MAGDIRAGKAFVELYMKGSFNKDLADATRKLKAFGDGLMNIGKKMLAVGSAITAPLALAAVHFANMGDAVNKASQRTGVAVEELTALKYAAEQSGMSFEDLEGALRKMSKMIFDAADGSDGAKKALAGLGIAVDDLKGLKPDEQFVKIADALSNVSDDGTKAAVAMEIFGKSGTSILPLIETGAAGINELTKRAHELGLVFGKEDAEAATKFGDTLDDLKKQVNAVIFSVGSAIASALQPFANAAIHIMTTVIQWTKENKSLAVGLLAAGVAIIAVGTGLVSMALAIKTVIMVGQTVSAVFSGISMLIAFMVNPIVLTCVALGALAAYFLYASGVGKAALDWLTARFQTLYATVQTVVGGIADALAAGDIGLAAQILWSGVQLAFLQGTMEIQRAWVKFKYGVTAVAAAAFYGALEIYQNVKAGLINAWDRTVAIFGDIWDGFTSMFGNAWDAVISKTAKGIMWVKSLFDGSDYKANAKAADDQLNADKGNRDAAAQQRIAQRHAQLQADLAATEKERQNALKNIDANSIGLAGGINQAQSDELSQIDAKKAALQGQLNKLRTEAAMKARRTKELESGPASLAKPNIDLDDLLNRRAEVATSAKSAGLFNVAALQSLQSGASSDYAKRTAKAAEETAKNTKNKAVWG